MQPLSVYLHASVVEGQLALAREVGPGVGECPARVVSTCRGFAQVLPPSFDVPSEWRTCLSSAFAIVTMTGWADRAGRPRRARVAPGAAAGFQVLARGSRGDQGGQGF